MLSKWKCSALLVTLFSKKNRRNTLSGVREMLDKKIFINMNDLSLNCVATNSTARNEFVVA